MITKHTLLQLHRAVTPWAIFGALALGALAAPASTLPPMLHLPGTGMEPEQIDFERLPVLPGEHTLVTHGNAPWGFRNHSYLAYHGDRYWCMWSQGTAVEDRVGQRVGYATSMDGLLWGEARFLSPEPRGYGPDSPLFGQRTAEGFRYIARGFWERDGELLALASLDEAGGFFGPSLNLHGFRWKSGSDQWEDIGVVARDTINNFPPVQMANGEWAMIRRDHRRNVSLLYGGVQSAAGWTDVPMVPYQAGGGFRPEEPLLWTLPDGRLMGFYRDNSRSKRVFRAVSDDYGRSWTVPERTNFPDATSKLFGMRTSRGWYVLISNANPAPLQRNPLCLSLSADGVTFTRLARLPVPTSPMDLRPREGARKAAGFQYPHAIEKEGHLFVVYSRNMTTIEVIRVPLDEIQNLLRNEGGTTQ